MIEPFALTSAHVLQLFPPFLQVAMVQDNAFRGLVEVTLTTTITIGAEKAGFDRNAYFAAIRQLHAGAAETTLQDAAGQAWTVRLDPDAPGAAVRLVCGSNQYQICLPVGLKLAVDERLADLDRALDRAGLPRTALVSWRDRLASGPLVDDAVAELERDLADTPRGVFARLQGISGGGLAVEDLAPTSPAYYERLAGAGVVEAVDDLAPRVVAPHVRDMLARESVKGAKMALVLGCRSRLLPLDAFLDLQPEAMVEMATWVVAEGDLISKVAFLEIGLAALARVPALEAPLLGVVDFVLGLDPADPSGPLAQLVSLFVLVDGEMSLSRRFATYRPFHRRYLALAQASLIARGWSYVPNDKGLIDWALEQRALDFHLQTLVDLRLEPRWQLRYGSADSWKAVFLGRLMSAVEGVSTALPEGPLRDKLLGADPAGLQSIINPFTAFRPGPLDGARLAGPNPVHASFASSLDGLMAQKGYGPAILNALYNLNGLFDIPIEQLDAIVDEIRAARHRLPSGLTPEQADGYLLDLAEVAATQRHVPLAIDLRVMARRRRQEARDPAAAIEAEFNVALTAGAAYADETAWADFIGDWVSEVAYATTDRDFAASIALKLDRLILKAPILRVRLGRAIAALESFAWS